MGPQLTVTQFQSRRPAEEGGSVAETRPLPEDIGGDPAPPPSQTSAGLPARWHWIATGGVFGALAGGVAAIGAVLAFTYLNPSLDPRVEALAVKLTSVGTSLEQLTGTVGTTQAEIARLLDLESLVMQRLAAQDEKIAALEQGAEAALAQGSADTGAGSTLFAIAVLQLRAAVLSGRPFEAELVHVYNLAGADPQVSPRLQTLVGPSRTGVRALSDLREQLAMLSAAAGIHALPGESYYAYGMSLVSKYIGYSSEPYETEAARHSIRQADTLLAAGEVAGAIERVLDLSETQAVQLEPWIEAARQRLTAETAISGLADVVIASLKERMAARQTE